MVSFKFAALALAASRLINAQIDPLTSEGEALAEALTAQGVDVQQMTYPGVTHEFFGMGAVVPEAKEATDMASFALRTVFEAHDPATADASVGELTDVEATAAEGNDAAAEGGLEPVDGMVVQQEDAAPAAEAVEGGAAPADQ